MHISEIRLQNFKKFPQAKFMFNKGINVIKGANEQGKSTILQAIIAGLFIDPSSTKYRELFKSWNSNTYPRVEIDFFVNENLYAIVKDFETKEVEFSDILNQKKETTMNSIQNALKEFIGISNENLLKSTACVNHDQMALIEEGKKSLEEALQHASLNDGKSNIIDVIRSLGAKIDEMQVGMNRPAKNNGILKSLQDEVNERTKELEGMKQKENGVDQANTKLTSLLKEQKDVDEQLVKYSKEIEDYEKKSSLVKEISLLDEQIKGIGSDLSRSKEFREKIDTLERKLTTLGGINLLDTLGAKQPDIAEVNIKIQEKQKELNDLHAQKPVKPIKKKRKVNSLHVILIAITAVVLVAIGVGIGYMVLTIIGLIFGVLGMILLIILGMSTDTEEKDISEYGLIATQNELSELQSKLQSLLTECGVNSVEEFYSKRTQLVATNSDLVQTKSTMDSMMRGSDALTLQQVMDESIQKKRELELQLPPGEIMPADQYTRDKRELELLQLDKKDIINEIAEEKAKVTTADVTPQQIKEKEEKLEEVSKKLAEANKKFKILQMVFDALSKAKDDISKNVADNIAHYVDTSLPKLTNGRYSSLRMDSNFKVEVFSKEKNDWIRPDNNVSKGTIDQIYLSARLGLANILTDGKPVPLFFDDPFITFDETRRNSLVEELKQISENHQVFIFTCHDFFDGAGNIVNAIEG